MKREHFDRLLYAHDAELDCSARAPDDRPAREHESISFQNFTVPGKGFVGAIYRGDEDVQAFRSVGLTELRDYLGPPSPGATPSGRRSRLA